MKRDRGRTREPCPRDVEFIRSPSPNLVARGYASAAVLMILVLVLFALARVLSGRPAGRLSKRQARKAASRSQRDLERFEARLAGATP